MAMNPPLLVATALSALNALLLVVIASVWYRNYRTFESTLTLGLLGFAATLFIENVVAVYFFFAATSLYGMGPAVGTIVAAMRALQFLALCFLTYVSME